MKLEATPLEREYINFLCNGAVKERLFALSDENRVWAVRWHQALNTVFSRSSSFTADSEYPKSDHRWVESGIAVRCPAGTVFFGVDTYNIFGDIILTDEDEEWNLWMEFTTENPEQLCNEIALAIQETIRIKVYWELKEKTDSSPLALILTHKQGYVDYTVITNSNGEREYKSNKWDASDVEEV